MDNKTTELMRDLRMIVFDFDGVLTDNRVIVMEGGLEAVICSRADGLGLSKMKELGVELLVLSMEKNPVVEIRCKKLGLRCIPGQDDKRPILEKEAASLGIDLRNVAYVGNDINDIKCLRAVGLPVCVADAVPEVREISRVITHKGGGKGAVREFCDEVFRAKTQ